LSSLDNILSALADPTRRSILERLGGGEARVTDLARLYPISLNSISKHIRVLEGAKLVRRRRAGREHILSLNPVPLDEVAAWVESHRKQWNAAFDRLDKALTKEQR
jgi:DNA-binding transcriptional ArsR family regulator